MPSNPSQNGASVTIIKDISIKDNKWLITSTDPTGFHLSLQLDTAWSSNPTKITKLSVEINSNTPISNTTNNLIASFTQNNIPQFITTILSIDNMNDHIIYPDCNIFTAKTWAMYNITNLLNTNTNTSLINKLINNYHGHFIPSRIPPNTAYPLTFILENNPFTHQMTFSYTNPDITARSCIYKEMAHNNTLNIYFTAKTFNISSLNITHSIYPPKKIDFELADEAQKWWEEDWVTSWETIVIAAASICYCICCIVMLCRYRIRRERRYNDRKLAYALQMANDSDLKGTETENINKSNTLSQMQQKNAAIAIPPNAHIPPSGNESTDNLVSSTGNMAANGIGGVIDDRTPTPEAVIPGVVIKSAPMDYEPTGDSFAPSPPLPPSTAPEPRFD